MHVSSLVIMIVIVLMYGAQHSAEGNDEGPHEAPQQQAEQYSQYEPLPVIARGWGRGLGARATLPPSALRPM